VEEPGSYEVVCSLYSMAPSNLIFNETNYLGISNYKLSLSIKFKG